MDKEVSAGHKQKGLIPIFHFSLNFIQHASTLDPSFPPSKLNICFLSPVPIIGVLSIMSTMPPIPEVLMPFVTGTVGKGFNTYSGQIYGVAYKTSLRPAITAKLDDLEDSAKQRMTPEAFDYIVGGASLGSTMKANREAFDHVRSAISTKNQVLPSL